MLNLVVIQGRLGKDIELRYLPGENSTAIANFSLAVTRNYKTPDGDYETDWIDCSAFGRTAENMEKFFKKGDLVLVNGWLKTGFYTDKNGNKVYTKTVNVDNFQFCGNNNQNANSTGTSQVNNRANDARSGQDLLDAIDDELPFN